MLSNLTSLGRVDRRSESQMNNKYVIKIDFRIFVSQTFAFHSRRHKRNGDTAHVTEIRSSEWDVSCNVRAYRVDMHNWNYIGIHFWRAKNSPTNGLCQYCQFNCSSFAMARPQHHRLQIDFGRENQHLAGTREIRIRRVSYCSSSDEATRGHMWTIRQPLFEHES